MKKLCTLVLLLAFAMCFVATDADAQRFTLRKRYASVGVHLGAMNYFGDIVPQPDFTSLRFKSTRPNVGISYTYRYFPRVSVRGSFHWGRILGDDKLSAAASESENLGRYKRNLSFRNDIKELSGVVIVDLFENRQTYRRRPDFVPYGFVGVAVFHHNPKAYYKNGSRSDIAAADDIPTGWYELQPLGTEGQYVEGKGYPEPYKRVQFAIPFGLGVRYKVDRYWDLSFEVGWRKTFTDYLDDASTSFADKADLLNNNGSTNPKASAILSDRSFEGGAQEFPSQIMPDPSPGVPYKRLNGYGTSANTMRGDRTDKDWYIVTGVSVNYILTPRIRSPKFR
ncbi:outer membrane beta-barrel protein [Pontibacter sp. Tf4]|uniref:DUF6089 family protein n=1 Tax=Pontibacter sp. Tf4 TaxID=2761620 RepID=UPI001624D81F|nr:DUF6089 family protein [Pontibacter sp. Tf4]MBB6612907.1 outer membrane beta-barrel protein [Pontibacter sp. Tf4]